MTQNEPRTASCFPAELTSTISGGLIPTVPLSVTVGASVGDEEAGTFVCSAVPQPAAAARRTRASRSLMAVRPTRARKSFLDLDENGVAAPAARADGREPEPTAVSPQLVDHRGENAGAGGADRVAQRDCAPVHVHAFGVGAEESAEWTTTEEKASLSSTRSTSPMSFPAFASARAPALPVCARDRRTHRPRRPGRRSWRAPRGRASARTRRS